MLYSPGRIFLFFDKYTHFNIIGHKEPDADCLASQYVLASALRRKGKTASLFSQGPFNRAEVRHWEAEFSQTLQKEDKKEGSAVVLLDCSNIERVGEQLQKDIHGLPLVIIDHHPTDKEEECYTAWTESSFPSVTLMVQVLIEELGLYITKEEAQLLFFGFCTDSGFFRHMEEGSGYFLHLVADLVQRGASPKKNFQAMYGGREFGQQVLTGRILSRARSFAQGKIIISREEETDREELDVDSRDSDTVYQLLSSIKDSELIILVRAESPQKCNIGLRSKEYVDVSALASSLGGGGHKRAAGLSLEMDIDQAEKLVLEKALEII